MYGTNVKYNYQRLNVQDTVQLIFFEKAPFSGTNWKATAFINNVQWHRWSFCWYALFKKQLDGLVIEAFGQGIPPQSFVSTIVCIILNNCFRQSWLYAVSMCLRIMKSMVAFWTVRLNGLNQMTRQNASLQSFFMRWIWRKLVLFKKTVPVKSYGDWWNFLLLKGWMYVFYRVIFH